MGRLRRSLSARARLLVRTVGRVSLEAMRLLQEGMAQVNLRPILVLGNQKSGTTAIAALLAHATGLSVALDLRKEVRRPTYYRIRTRQMPLSEFIARNRLDFSRDIIKDPNLTLFYPELRRHFPDSKAVFIARDPRDNIRSVLDRLALPGNSSASNSVCVDSIPPGWRPVLDCRWLGLAGKNYVEILAARWDHMARMYLENRRHLRLIRYEDFLRDKVGAIARLAGELALGLVADVSDRVDIQYQPRGNPAVRWEGFFGDNLQAIERVCRNTMESLGYCPFSV